MKDYDPDKENADGSLILVYGPAGVGKTTSCLRSLPEPILCILSEKRNPKRSLNAIDRKVNVKFKVPSGFEDFLEFLATEAEKSKFDYRTLLMDSFSHLVNYIIKFEAQEETYEAGIFPQKRKFVDQFRLDLPAYGGIATAALRLNNLMGTLSQKGLIVVCTALEDQTPNWAPQYYQAPLFLGKEYGKNMQGLFDLIGRVRTRLDKDTGKAIYPPMVDFEKNPEYIAKWTGKQPKTTSGPLDFKAILGIKEKGK